MDEEIMDEINCLECGGGVGDWAANLSKKQAVRPSMPINFLAVVEQQAIAGSDEKGLEVSPRRSLLWEWPSGGMATLRIGF